MVKQTKNFPLHPLASSVPDPDGYNAAASGRHRPASLSALLAAPHRLGFLLATAVLITSSLWWLHILAARQGWLPTWPLQQSPSTVHAVLMIFGFFPLFFAGFLFTAGPKWLSLPPVETRTLAPALLSQAAGWLLWITGGHVSQSLGLAGLALSLLGQASICHRFFQLLRASRVPDRVHAHLIAWFALLGCVSLAGLGASLAFTDHQLASAWLHTGLWGYITATFITVMHRMLPFFTSAALPMVTVWRPFWVLGFLLCAVGVKLLGTWLTWLGLAGGAWLLFQSLWLLVSGWVVLWLALTWGLVQSLKIRLLAMLHIGFVWLGLAFLLGALSDYWAMMTQGTPLSMGALHALSMGFLGSLMLAMVTRVSCGHGGRSLVADHLVWSLFWVLQAACVLRIAADWPALESAANLLLAAALLWSLCMTVWGVRHLDWYIRPRQDGRPG